MATGSFKLPISSGGEEWVRPADWLPMPTVTSANDTFVGLHAVFPEGQNYVAFRFGTSAGQYQVDWGDGTINTYNTNVVAEYQYDYATISNSTLSSRGYKQVIITVTAVSGNLTSCNFQQRFTTVPAQNQAYSTGFLDCILSLPNAASGQTTVFGGGLVAHRYVERLDIKTIGGATNLNTQFQSCNFLQSVPLFDTSNVTTMNNAFENCSSINKIPLFNTANVTSFISCFLGCSLRGFDFPLLNTSSATTMQNMFANSGIKNIPLFNTANVVNMSGMFLNSAIITVPILNTSNVTNFSNMFQTCRFLKSIPSIPTSATTITAGVDFASFIINGNSLSRCEMVFARTVQFTNCQLSRTALVEIFNNLVSRTLTTSATITISGNWGASALTAGERLIATSKNWVIVG
jgi:hypothetical protein